MYFGNYGYINTAVNPLKDIRTVTVRHAEFDWLYATNEPSVNDGYTPMSDTLPEWQAETCMATDYENSASASGAHSDYESAEAYLIRRRRSDDDPWLTIAYKEINEMADLFRDYYDWLCLSGQEYQYIVVPIINGIESNYYKGDMSEYVKTYFDGIYISDMNELWGTPLNPSYERTRNQVSNVVTTLSSKYPTVVNNGMINYYSGNTTGLFIEINNHHDIIFDGHAEYRDYFYDFLTNKYPKIMRTYDDRIYMIQVEDNVTEDGTYPVINSTFNWVEIGDATDYQDLYDNGFIYKE